MVWECERTQKLFRSREEYDAHLAGMVALAKDRRALATAKRTFNKVAATLRDCRSFTEIEQWILTHWDFLNRACNREKLWCKLTRVEISQVSWGDQSTSHNAPIGQRRNWDGKALNADGTPVPRYHPGFRCSITFWTEQPVKKKYARWEYDFLRPIGLSLGGGGGGRLRYRYDLILWDADFPLLANDPENVLCQEAIAQLHNVEHFNRASVADRAKKYSDFAGSYRYLSSNGVKERLDEEIDLIALCFGDTDFHYLVRAWNPSPTAESNKEFLRVGNTSWCVYCDADKVVELRMSGKIGEIIDLAKRRERVLSPIAA